MFLVQKEAHHIYRMDSSASYFSLLKCILEVIPHRFRDLSFSWLHSWWLCGCTHVGNLAYMLFCTCTNPFIFSGLLWTKSSPPPPPSSYVKALILPSVTIYEDRAPKEVIKVK